MKLKKNELLEINIMCADGDFLKTGYLTSSEAKGLRKNSKHLSFNDGNNWVTQDIEVVGVVKYEESKIEEEQGNPQYTTIWNIVLESEEVELRSSNCSGSLSPYWELASEEW